MGDLGRFTVYNDPDAPENSAPLSREQAEPDKVDWEILAGAFRANGVVGGLGNECVVTSLGDLDLKIDTGVTLHNGTRLEHTEQFPTLDSADTSFPRFDLVVISNSGAFAIRKGEADGNPCFKEPQDGDVVLAAVLVPASAAAVSDDNITDKRVLIWNDKVDPVGRVVLADAYPGASDDEKVQAAVDDLGQEAGVVLLDARHRSRIDTTTTLDGAIDADATTIFPSSGGTFYVGEFLQIDAETVEVLLVVSSTELIVRRSADGTIATGHLDEAVIYQILNAWLFANPVTVRNPYQRIAGFPEGQTARIFPTTAFQSTHAGKYLINFRNRFFPSGKLIQEPVDDSETVIDVDANPSTWISVGDVIQFGEDEEIMSVAAVDDVNDRITVRRGKGGTEAESHDDESEVMIANLNYGFGQGCANLQIYGSYVFEATNARGILFERTSYGSVESIYFAGGLDVALDINDSQQFTVRDCTVDKCGLASSSAVGPESLGGLPAVWLRDWLTDGETGALKTDSGILDLRVANSLWTAILIQDGSFDVYLNPRNWHGSTILGPKAFVQNNPLTSGGTTLDVGSGNNIDFAIGELLRIEDELVRVTSIGGSPFSSLGIERSYLGTIADEHDQDTEIRRANPILDVTGNSLWITVGPGLVSGYDGIGIWLRECQDVRLDGTRIISGVVSQPSGVHGIVLGADGQPAKRPVLDSTHIGFQRVFNIFALNSEEFNLQSLKSFAYSGATSHVRADDPSSGYLSPDSRLGPTDSEDHVIWNSTGRLRGIIPFRRAFRPSSMYRPAVPDMFAAAPADFISDFDDFHFYDTGHWTQATNGSSTVTQLTGSDAAKGLIRLQAGSTNGNYASLFHGEATFPMSSHPVLKALIRPVTNTDVIYRVGLVDGDWTGTATAPADGYYLESTNGNDWRGVIRRGNSPVASQDLDVPPATNNFQLIVVVVDANGDVEFFIGEQSLGIVSGNTSSDVLLTPAFHIQNNAGSQTRQLDVDFALTISYRS